MSQEMHDFSTLYIHLLQTTDWQANFLSFFHGKAESKMCILLFSKNMLLIPYIFLLHISIKMSSLWRDHLVPSCLK